MRLLVVASPGIETTVLGFLEELNDRGAELVFGVGRRGGEIPQTLLDRAGVSVASVPLERSGPELKALRVLRAGANALRYMDPALAGGGGFAREQTARALAKKLKLEDETPLLEARIPERIFGRLEQVARDVERLVPPHAELEAAVAALQPDGVLLVSRCGLNSVELDVVKVARALGLPSTMLVHSWDNLSSKAVLHEHPDHLLVWNDAQAWEATAYHAIDPERVEVVGAPIFDRFFALAAEAGPPPADGTRIVYLGSSPYVADNRESALFDEWHAALRASGDAALRDASIDIRPHPADHSWDTWQPPDERVTLHRSKKFEAEKLLALLHRANAVVALNTSAEIEAAIAGRPVVTFRAGRLAYGQEGTLHFRYLLESEGGFVLDAADVAENVAKLSRVVAGDFDRGRIDAFVERFLRPAGLDQPVSPLAAEKVLELVARRTPAPAS